MFFVYILSNNLDSDLYKGFTTNPVQRLIQHNNKESSFTSNKIPWNMFGLFEFETKKEALIFERKIKKWNRKSIDGLIAGNQNILVEFTALSSFT